MLIEGKVLDLIYRQIAPERVRDILEKGFQGESEALNQNFKEETLRLYLDYAETTLHGYSEDEQDLVYKRIQFWIEKWAATYSVDQQCAFLVPLIKVSGEYLIMSGKYPVCKNGKVLNWRNAYLRIGQDVLVCAFLANRDRINHIERIDFTWPVILREDNTELYRILERGMAENHNHINGGTQSFQITWCRMMNYPEMIRRELKHFKDGKYLYKVNRGTKNETLDIYDTLELAALIRSILFRALHRDDFYNSSNNTLFDGRRAYFEEYIKPFCRSNVLIDMVGQLRSNYGLRINTIEQTDYCLDYALEEKYFESNVNSKIRVVLGERAFMYNCIRACLEWNTFSMFEKGLFYLYLILQCNFRSEMIQNNEQTGFKNFLNYQNRKDDAWDETPFFGEAVRMAINNRLESRFIKSLEGRLVPKADVDKNIQKIIRFDTAKRFADCPEDKTWDRRNYQFDPDLDLDQMKELPYFFVYHFIKSVDKERPKLNAFVLPKCRHADLRNSVEKQAMGLASALKKSSYLRCRLRGIDAAANEFLCRPEIFAVAYRYLAKIQDTWSAESNKLMTYSPMRISKAYHAGEDFLDIAGGLRAIDEAIEYLHLGPGSRIGHALALGVDPEIHYKTKHYEIVTTRQERLDDIVWILFKTKELGVKIDYLLEAELRKEAQYLYREIYGKAILKHNWDHDLRNYRDSMRLRGDDPAVYISGKYIEPKLDASDITDCYVDRSDQTLKFCRENDCIAGLYYYYHFGTCERQCGSETYLHAIGKDYIMLMRQIQDAMMGFINDRKLIIECNPSSNVLIGTFKDYKLHPIFRFNNRKLVRGDKEEKPQLSVCVNTDDLGIFDTSLEFEYALLYEALISQTNCEKKPLYNDKDVIDYLDDLREMGIRAVFPSNTGV